MVFDSNYTIPGGFARTVPLLHGLVSILARWIAVFLDFPLNDPVPKIELFRIGSDLLEQFILFPELVLIVVSEFIILPFTRISRYLIQPCSLAAFWRKVHKHMTVFYQLCLD
jgi:hypothetical protein